MAAVSGVFLLFTLFQLAGAAMLWQRSLDGRRLPVRLLAALLCVNAALSAATALEAEGLEGATRSTPFLAVDSLTGGLLLATAAAWRGRPRLAAGAATFGLLGACAIALAPAIPRTPVLNMLLVVVPYYTGAALVMLSLSRGSEAARWVALAFVPRALLFFSQSAFGFARGAFPTDAIGWSAVALNAALAASALVASVRIARGGIGPSLGLVVAAILLAPVDAYAWWLAEQNGASIVTTSILNYLTLCVVRPLLLYIGLARDAMRPLLANTAFAGGVAVGIVALGPVVGLYPLAAALVGLSLGSLTLAVLHAKPAPPSFALAEEPASADGRPQWQTLLLSLHVAEAGGAGPPRFAWTQKSLAQQTGISVKRVSEFPGALNASAAQKLARHLPGAPVGPLVTTHKGAVEGASGVWVYYRLTPTGVRLAETLLATSTPVAA